MRPGTELPTHWNAAGQVDGTMPALAALLVPVVLVVATSLVFAIIPRIEPLQDRLEGSASVLRTSWIGLLGLALLIEIAVAAPAFGRALPVALPLLGAGLFLLLIGNVLPKSRPGFFVGIRTPWAIIDTDNWIATHRLGGKLMMAAGLVMVLAALLPLGPDARTAAIAGSVGFAAIPPPVYSWWLWHRKKVDA